MTEERQSSGSGSGCLYWFLGIVVCLSVLGIIGDILDDNPKKSRLDEWFDDYSLSDCEDNVKSRLRDPDSYKRVQLLLPTKVSDEEKIHRWDFRAKNGFGGYNLSTAECIVKKEGNGSISTTIKELN